MSSIEAEEEIVDSLAIIMKGKLRANAFKPSWTNAKPADLLEYLEAEVGELKEAIELGGISAIKLECADIANMAAMIAHVAGFDSDDVEFDSACNCHIDCDDEDPLSYEPCPVHSRKRRP